MSALTGTINPDQTGSFAQRKAPNPVANKSKFVWKKAAHQMHFASGAIVVDGPRPTPDRGYNDYRLFAQWTDAGVYSPIAI